MIEAFQNYLLRLVICGAFCAVLRSTLPGGIAKQVISVTCGLLLILVAIAPLKELDLDKLAQSISRFEITMDAEKSGILVDNQELISDIIKEKTETYIWDKAESAGMRPKEITAEINCDGAYPYPEKIRITGEYTTVQQQQISSWITAEFAVAKEHQEWTWTKTN